MVAGEATVVMALPGERDRSARRHVGPTTPAHLVVALTTRWACTWRPAPRCCDPPGRTTRSPGSPLPRPRRATCPVACSRLLALLLGFLRGRLDVPRRDIVHRGLHNGIGPVQRLPDLHRARVGDQRNEPRVPGGDRGLQPSASSLRWCRCRSLPPAAPAAPSTAALPMIDGGKITPSTTPPTTPQVSPDLCCGRWPSAPRARRPPHASPRSPRRSRRWRRPRAT